MTAIPAAPSQIIRWAVALMFLANGFVMGVWATQIPLLLPRHDITKPILGLLLLGFGIGAVSAMLFSGKLLARFGSRRLTQAFALLLVPTLPLVVFAQTIPTLAVAMALMGAIGGTMDVAMNANAVVVERRLNRAIMSSSHGFWSIGGFFGGLGGGPVIATFGAEIQALMAASVVLALALIAIPFLAQDPGREATAGAATGQARGDTPPLFPRKLGIWVLGLMSLFSMIPEGAVLDWSAIYLMNDHQSTVSQSGLAFALFSGSMAVLRFLGDALRNRFGAVRVLRTSALIGASGMMIAALAPSQAFATAGFLICGIGVANMIPVIFSAAGNYPGVVAGSAISTVTMLGYSGILVAPTAIGFIAHEVGFRVTFAGLSVLMLVVAAMASRAAMADGIRSHEG